MKNNILIFAIGLLLGAVIATGAFYVYNKSNTCNNSTNSSMSGGTPPSMPDGQPPEMPNGTNSSNSTPPEKPSDNTTQNNY